MSCLVYPFYINFCQKEWVSGLLTYDQCNKLIELYSIPYNFENNSLLNTSTNVAEPLKHCVLLMRNSNEEVCIPHCPIVQLLKSRMEFNYVRNHSNTVSITQRQPFSI